MPPAKRCRGKETPVQDDEVWGDILNVEVKDVALPRTATEFMDALGRLDEFLTCFPALQGKGRASSKGHVLRKRLLRKFALSMLRRMPRDVARALPWGEVRAATPDQDEHMSGFDVSDS